MSNINLKEYTTKLKDLEIAIFTQERLAKEHKILLDRQKPNEPLKTELVEPVPPTHPGSLDFSFTNGAIVVSAIVLILGIVLSCLDNGLLQWLGALLLVVGAIAMIGLIISSINSKRDHEATLQNYEKK